MGVKDFGAVNDAIHAPEVARRIVELGATGKPMTPDALGQFLADEDKVIEALAKSGLLKTE